MSLTYMSDLMNGTQKTHLWGTNLTIVLTITNIFDLHVYDMIGTTSVNVLEKASLAF